MPSGLPHQRKNPTRLNMSPASSPPPLPSRGHTSGKRDSLASSSPLCNYQCHPPEDSFPSISSSSSADSRFHRKALGQIAEHAEHSTR